MKLYFRIVLSSALIVLVLLGVITALKRPNDQTVQAPVTESSAKQKEQLVLAIAPQSPILEEFPATVLDTHVDLETNALPSESEIARIHRLYAFATDSRQRLRLLSELMLITEGVDEALVILRLALTDADAAVRQRALNVLVVNELFWASDLLSIIELGLSDASPVVQQEAARLLNVVGIGRYPGLFVKALSSVDEAVQQSTLSMINTTTTSIPIEVYAEALTSTNPGIRLAVVDILCSQKAKRGIPLLIDALDDPDGSVATEARHNLFFLIDEDFESQEAAQEFWKHNAGRFSESIFDSYLPGKGNQRPLPFKLQTGSTND